MLSKTQLIKVSKFINISTWKKEWMSQYIWYTFPSQILTTTIKPHTNMSHSCVNLIKECTTSNSGIIAFNPNNISTLVNKHKLDLARVIMGASNVIFMKKMWYLDNICLLGLIMDIHLVLMPHNILLPFFFMISIKLANSKCLLRLWFKRK